MNVNINTPIINAAEAETVYAPTAYTNEYTEDTPPHSITRERLDEAIQTLTKYKQGKAALEQRIIDEELWYLLRQNKYLKRQKGLTDAVDAPISAWLFSSVCNKHADSMDNYPTAACLPRERSDEEDAKILSKIVPVIIEKNGFEQIYSDNEWYKIKHGMAAYGIFWNNNTDNGLGDISIKRIDVLNLFWEPGVADIQDSRNLFITALVDDDVLKAQYPSYKGMGGNVVDIGQYVYDDAVDPKGKCLVVDWYYKTMLPDGRTVLQLCKFVGNTVLFATEDNEAYPNGWYEDGAYPVVIDVLYPVEGTCTGVGVIAVGKNPQMYIDRMDKQILEHMEQESNIRYFAKKDLGINLDDFLDQSKRIVEVEGNINDEKLRQITISPLNNTYISLKNLKVDELKETTSNRDVSQGSSSGGVTAASAIAALQEAGNKNSRDMLTSTYRAYVKIISLVIERIRQFYDEERTFRIMGNDGYEFVAYSNANIRMQTTGVDSNGYETSRKPIFDIDVRAAKMNPYNQLSQNETMKELFRLGVFNPDLAQQALGMLEGMNFDGIEQVKDYVKQGKTLKSQLDAVAMALAQMGIDIQALLTGGGMPPMVSGTSPMSDLERAQQGGLEAARTPMAKEYAERARADAAKKGKGASVR